MLEHAQLLHATVFVGEAVDFGGRIPAHRDRGPNHVTPAVAIDRVCLRSLAAETMADGVDTGRFGVFRGRVFTASAETPVHRNVDTRAHERELQKTVDS